MLLPLWNENKKKKRQNSKNGLKGKLVILDTQILNEKGFEYWTSE